MNDQELITNTATKVIPSNSGCIDQGIDMVENEAYASGGGDGRYEDLNEESRDVYYSTAKDCDYEAVCSETTTEEICKLHYEDCASIVF